nr:unnamed protein product [Callosobruchus chinensis]
MFVFLVARMMPSYGGSLQ